MVDQYINKNFIVIIRRKSDLEPFTYFFKFEDNNHANKKDAVPSKWKDSIISSFFQTDTYIEDPSLFENNTDTFAIRIIIHSAKDLLVGQSYHEAEVPTFAQFYLQERVDDENVSSNGVGEKKGNSIIPIIHITLTNLYVDNMYGDNVELPSLVPRSYQIMDSSIWNYLVPINGIPSSTKQSEETGRERFYSVINSIYNNYKKKLYYLSVSHEYADLNARLALQSFLSGAHASGVAPFIFHSESAIKRMITEEFYEHTIIDKTTKEEKSEGRNTISSIVEKKWRILLVDDKAVSPMDSTDNSHNNDVEFSWNCKLTIIRDLLEKRLGERGRIHCRSCDEKSFDCTLTLHFLEKKSFFVENIDVYSEATGIVFFRNKITSFVSQAVQSKAGEQIFKTEDEKADWVLKEIRKILFDIIPIGDKVEGYKLYFNKKAVDYQINKSTLVFLRQTFKDNKEIEIEEGCPTTTNIVIEYAQNVEEAERALKGKKYDIILLDYLLNGENRKQYGYKVLDDIYEALDGYKGNYSSNKEGYKIGPSERFFFIFISAYSSAVYERLLAEGLNRSEKYWHIAVGACPTNTPQLFLYNLIKLMEKRLEDSGVDKLSPRGIFDIVNSIYGDTNKVRDIANEKYQDVLDLHYLYRKMLKDVEIPQDSIYNTQGSVLITNFITKNVNLGGLLEHLTQLIHLTAFGTVRQWPEMWEEYIYFKAQFDLNQFKEDTKQIKEWNAEKKFHKLCEDIESYILKLKSDIE